MSAQPIRVTEDLSKILEQIQQNLKDFRNESNSRFDKIDERLNKLEVGQAEIKGEIKALRVEITSTKEDVKEIKSSQKAQIWTLIGTTIAAILGILTAMGRLIFFPNP